MISRRTIVQTSLAGGLIVALAGFALVANLVPAPDREEQATGWRRIAWPFPRDAFPAGRAWTRDGTEVYVRPKLGFCGNCETGVKLFRCSGHGPSRASAAKWSRVE